MAEQPTVHDPTRTEAVGRSGIYPASGPLPPSSAVIRGQGALAHPEERDSGVDRHVGVQTIAHGIGRVLFGGYFLYSGINHFVHRRMLAQYAASKGVTNPEVAVIGSGALLAAGGLAVLTGRQTKLGAAALVTFLLGVTPTMHDFWTAKDEGSRMNEFVNFTKNVALIGAALLTVAIPEPWPVRIGMAAHQRTTALALLSRP